MSDRVQIEFDCLPLRSVGRMDVPIDASPAFAALCERVKKAAQRHGLHNAYYLHNAKCAYCLTNDERVGMLEFVFEGTVLTDPDDRKTLWADLQVDLRRETCDWLTTPIIGWFRETVNRAVIVEFDRFIAAGDLERTVRRLDQIQAQSDAQGGFLGIGL
jgi:hypothetical protein